MGNYSSMNTGIQCFGVCANIIKKHQIELGDDYVWRSCSSKGFELWLAIINDNSYLAIEYWKSDGISGALGC